MKRTAVLALALLLMLNLFAGCKNVWPTGEKPPPAIAETNNPSNSETEKVPSETGTPVDVDFDASAKDMFSNRDYEIGYKESDCISIQLNGNTAAASDQSVKIDGSTITLTKNASYIISGTLENGMIIVNAPDTAKIQIVLDGVDMTSKSSAPLYILEADKVFLTTAPDSVNTLSSGDSFAAIDKNDIDAAIYSKQDLTMNGSGTLTVHSPAGHGIVSKDDLVITSGTYVVNAASHGLNANDSVRIVNAGMTITAGKDGIHAENNDDEAKGFVYIASGSLKIEAEGDGISAGAYMQIENGHFDILAGGGYKNGSQKSSGGWGVFTGGRGGKGIARPSPPPTTTGTDNSSTSMKGLKSGSDMLISDGVFIIDSADDALHANTSLIVNGGTFTIATGDDALHAEEKLSVTAGRIDISTCYEGLEALHIHVSGGDITLTATDDGLNAAGGTDSSGTAGGRDGMFGGRRMPSSFNGSILISGGTLYIQAHGDGIDANGTLTITGGHTTIAGPIQGDTATLDYEVSGIITGGTFIGTGSTMMAQSFSDSEQGVIAVNAGSQSAGTPITLTDKTGKTIITRTPELPFAVVILSSPDMISGETYTLTIGERSSKYTAR